VGRGRVPLRTREKGRRDFPFVPESSSLGVYEDSRRETRIAPDHETPRVTERSLRSGSTPCDCWGCSRGTRRDSRWPIMPFSRETKSTAAPL